MKRAANASGAGRTDFDEQPKTWFSREALRYLMEVASIDAEKAGKELARGWARGALRFEGIRHVHVDKPQSSSGQHFSRMSGESALDFLGGYACNVLGIADPTLPLVPFHDVEGWIDWEEGKCRFEHSAEKMARVGQDCGEMIEFVSGLRCSRSAVEALAASVKCFARSRSEAPPQLPSFDELKQLAKAAEKGGITGGRAFSSLVRDQYPGIGRKAPEAAWKEAGCKSATGRPPKKLPVSCRRDG